MGKFKVVDVRRMIHIYVYWRGFLLRPVDHLDHRGVVSGVFSLL